MATQGERDGTAVANCTPAVQSEPPAMALSAVPTETLEERPPLPLVLTADELAALLRLDRKTVYAAFRAVLRWLEEGRAPVQGCASADATLRRGQAGVSRARKGDAR